METVWSQALVVLETRGWCKDTVEEGDGRVCFIGAINVAIFGNAEITYGNATDLAREVRRHKLKLVNEFLGLPDVADWNDEPERTFEDVKTVLVQLHEKEVANA